MSAADLQKLITECPDGTLRLALEIKAGKCVFTPEELSMIATALIRSP